MSSSTPIPDEIESGNNLISLRNTHAFPAFHACPDEKSTNLSYYTVINSNELRPHRHWCLLAEITVIAYFVRPRLLLRDIAGEEIAMVFYTQTGNSAFEGMSDPVEWNHQGFKVGQCVALLYPFQHRILSGEVGIRHEMESYAKVS
jgi:hypothetical protein